MILNIDEDAGRVVLEGLQSTKVVVRHLDDVKEFHGKLDLGEDNEPPEVGTSLDVKRLRSRMLLNLMLTMVIFLLVISFTLLWK